MPRSRRGWCEPFLPAAPLTLRRGGGALRLLVPTEGPVSQCGLDLASRDSMRPRVNAQSRAQPPAWMQAPSPWPLLPQTDQVSVRGSHHPLLGLIICWNSLQNSGNGFIHCYQFIIKDSTREQPKKRPRGKE